MKKYISKFNGSIGGVPFELGGIYEEKELKKIGADMNDFDECETDIEEDEVSEKTAINKVKKPISKPKKKAKK